MWMWIESSVSLLSRRESLLPYLNIDLRLLDLGNPPTDIVTIAAIKIGELQIKEVAVRLSVNNYAGVKLALQATPKEAPL